MSYYTKSQNLPIANFGKEADKETSLPFPNGLHRWWRHLNQNFRQTRLFSIGSKKMLDGDFEGAACALQKVSPAHKHYELAQERLRQIEYLNDLPFEWFEPLLRFALESGQYIGMWTLAVRGIQRFPSDSTLQELFQVSEERMQEFWQGHLNPPPMTSKVEQLIITGEKLLNQGEYTQALQAYQNALKQRPHDPQALIGIAQCQALLYAPFEHLIALADAANKITKERGIALLYIRQALLLKPDDQTALSYLAQIEQLSSDCS